MTADSCAHKDMDHTSTVPPNMELASEKVEHSIQGPEHLSSSPASPKADADKEDSFDATMASDEHHPDAVDASSNGVSKFEPGYRFYLAFSSLAVLAMMVALDGTSVSVALPVRLLISLYLGS